MISSWDAAFVIIAAMGLGGVRKLELELGESAMVMGLGLLGIFAVQFCRLSGAYPVIAADPNPERRALALRLGADYAFDPMASDFVEQVKAVTKGKGVQATVEVTGVAAAMKQALECASWMGRISLLGCTRVSDCAIDYYQQVHRPGIKLIGAHNFVRPKMESYPHHWTHQDDCKAILDATSELLIPGAIRTLADRDVQFPLPVKDRNGALLNNPTHPYCGRYEGDEDTRRKVAYHNGTAWPWVFPSWPEAYYMTYGAAGRRTAVSVLSTMTLLMDGGYVTQLAEILDGDYPHTLRGCGAQAWSITEFYRVWTLLHKKHGNTEAL
jgi:hypothetical protein